MTIDGCMPEILPGRAMIQQPPGREPTTRVLFVCTGNICRSPTAEAVFRRIVDTAGHGERFAVDSAGTHGYHLGDPPDARAIAIARRRGYDLSGLRARQLTQRDFAAFDLLLAMDRGHLTLMQRLAPPAARDRARLFLSYAPALGTADVPDPYYGAERDFLHALDLIERGAQALLDALLAGEAPRLSAGGRDFL